MGLTLTLCLRRRRKSWQNDFSIRFGRGAAFDGPDGQSESAFESVPPSMSMRSPSTRRALDMLSELDPKPYQYGLVGSLNRHSSLLSPTSSGMSPPMSPTQEYLDSSKQRSASPEALDYMSTVHSGRSMQSHSSMAGRPRRAGSGSVHGLESIFDAQQLYHSPEQSQQVHLQDPQASNMNRPQSGRSSLLHRQSTVGHASVHSQPSLSAHMTYGPRPSRSKSSGNSNSHGTTPSRPSTGGSQKSNLSTETHLLTPLTPIYPMMPARIRHASLVTHTTLDLPDAFGIDADDDRVIGFGVGVDGAEGQGDEGRKPLMRTLTLTNWNPSTDAISLADETPRAVAAAPGTPWGGLDASTDSPASSHLSEGVRMDSTDRLQHTRTQKPPLAHLE